jgi:hypothetical protein
MFKYVMFSDGHRSMPIIFPKEFVHSNMADAFTSIAEHVGFKPISAGEVSIQPCDNILGFRFICFGESTTLKLKSKHEDGNIITNHPWAFGIPGFSLPISL